ncbi:hypothetical protein R3W88_030883 [Solanum pinnatisectum]|uniref:Protein kinase domain-containing protein n=1 Tax=Solanum pinnatisectum TaxID=50273 RepID=A0AAV9LJU8_9SOLN|nr:hypothetical protein R3W88_030883 [Solanum pinnatisectum]
MEKTNSRTRPFFFICTFLGFLLILLSRVCVCSAAESEFYCLKSIKDSLQDPCNSLGSWDFSNVTEGFICQFRGIECWHDYENKFPRGIRNCTSLTGLDLSDNNFYGTIPSDISVIVEHVTILDLSSNKFSGNIPPDIANCGYLNFLMLNNNNLGGEIPSRIGSRSRLSTFSVANNNLTGPVPSFVNIQITAHSFANNSELCGKPFKECEYYEDSWIWKHVDRASFIEAFVCGWVLFFTLVLVLCLFKFPVKAINKIVSLNIWKLRKKDFTSGSEEELSSHQKLEKFVTRTSFTEPENTTSDFSEDYLVGNGMLGKVYKAILPNDWTLAIKKLNDWENLEDEFVSEIRTLCGLRHRNLLPLIGFCVEREKNLPVYKYMHNGNLHEWLHSNKDKAKILDFPKGLAWLHHGCKLHVTHGSISTRCILLAKIWSKNDSALSWRLFPVAEYSCLGSYKKNIYCFGVLLLELVTGKEPHDLTSSRNLFDHSPCLLDADKDLLGKGINYLILEFLELACDCVKFLPNERPVKNKDDFLDVQIILDI